MGSELFMVWRTVLSSEIRWESANLLLPRLPTVAERLPPQVGPAAMGKRGGIDQGTARVRLSGLEQRARQ